MRQCQSLCISPPFYFESDNYDDADDFHLDDGDNHADANNQLCTNVVSILSSVSVMTKGRKTLTMIISPLPPPRCQHWSSKSPPLCTTLVDEY